MVIYSVFVYMPDKRVGDFSANNLEDINSVCETICCPSTKKVHADITEMAATENDNVLAAKKNSNLMLLMLERKFYVNS